MKDLEKQAKLGVLKNINSQAKKAMSSKLKKKEDCEKDSPALKKHVKEMSDETDIDFKNDSDSITDPENEGNVVGRHISDENGYCCDEDLSVYDIDERSERLMRKKKQAKSAAGYKE